MNQTMLASQCLLIRLFRPEDFAAIHPILDQALLLPGQSREHLSVESRIQPKDVETHSGRGPSYGCGVWIIIRLVVVSKVNPSPVSLRT